MLTLHHLNNSRSQRILWMLEELNLEYELISYQRNPETGLAPASLRRIHPLGKSPVLEHDGRTIVESGAIIEYISEEFDSEGLLTPESLDDRTKAKIWIHYSEGSIMMPIMLNLIFSKMGEAKTPILIRPLANQIVKKMIAGVHEAFLDEQIALHTRHIADALSDSTFFVGEKLTTADIAMSFPLETMVSKQSLGPLDEGMSKLFLNYVQKIQGRAAYQRALARGGKYDYLAPA